MLGTMSQPWAILIIISLLLGGGAAWLTGRGIALTWQPLWRCWVWMLPLALAVRFIHFALFKAGLMNIAPYFLDLFILIACSSFGYAVTRARQMSRQYGFTALPETASTAKAGESHRPARGSSQGENQ